MKGYLLMNIEKEIFKKSPIIYDKLVPYGFVKKENEYQISKYILNNSFRVDIEISNRGEIKGKIYDLAFNEEYTNYKIENQNGKFAHKVREEYQNILLEIKENCTINTYFMMNQSNRITDLIIKKYNDKPQFIWEKFPEYGIFRNPNNNKWYGLIMNINKSKIDIGNEIVEVLNVKLDQELIIQLLNRKSFYQAYHMNKKNWITILLDDSIPDEEIMSYIEQSHKFTE